MVKWALAGVLGLSLFAGAKRRNLNRENPLVP